MKRAVILTGHFPNQKRRPSLLWVSHHLQKSGWHVTHVTVGFSWISQVLGDPRLTSLDDKPCTGVWHPNPNLTTIFGYAPVHPINLRQTWLTRLAQTTWPLFTAYWERRLQGPLRQADLAMCESGPPILLAPTLAHHAQQAQRIYRVNDDIRLLNAPDGLIAAEQRNLECFTRISTASPVLAKRFAKHTHVTLDPMGIPKSLVNHPHADPYKHSPNCKIVVCAGTTQLDVEAIMRIATSRPNWNVHILGRLKKLPPKRGNLFWHGEQNFEKTLAHIAHADIGLSPYLDKPGIEYQVTNSNRMLLYRHFGLPILGPDRLCSSGNPSIFGYNTPNAMDLCEEFPHRPEDIPDWSELARRLVQKGVTDPPSEVSTDPATISKSRVKTVPALASSA
ncbi:hypothetical protein [Roseovarius rhodophyticola]|uniref:Glucuronosyltransferase GumK N-terminal domain-containing protein n=1 Tax=Roseovarius rhodophyticola TaxID=3080827 RepID=A0ABZ2TJJ8_9RHOB|nr:hypothetical protein [Roseovarius sp. W115]MDV2930212.1 hypothetical protein [Roseovarius sp. W115]